jgi:single-strand DNA-binding protein
METINDTIKLIGRPGAAPVVTHFNENKMVARFSLATKEESLNEAGEIVQITRWHKIVAWGMHAALVQQKVKKGKMMSIIGKAICRRSLNTDGHFQETNEIVLYNLHVFETQPA